MKNLTPHHVGDSTVSTTESSGRSSSSSSMKKLWILPVALVLVLAVGCSWYLSTRATVALTTDGNGNEHHQKVDATSSYSTTLRAESESGEEITLGDMSATLQHYMQDLFTYLNWEHQRSLCALPRTPAPLGSHHGRGDAVSNGTTTNSTTRARIVPTTTRPERMDLAMVSDEDHDDDEEEAVAAPPPSTTPHHQHRFGRKEGALGGALSHRTPCGSLRGHSVMRNPPSPPPLLFASLFPYDMQVLYWEAQVRSLLRLGVRVAGTDRSAVEDFLTSPFSRLWDGQPEEEVEVQELARQGDGFPRHGFTSARRSLYFRHTSPGSSITGQLALSDAGRALACRHGLLLASVEEGNATSRMTCPPPNTDDSGSTRSEKAAGRLPDDSSLGNMWSLDEDAFEVVLPVDPSASVSFLLDEMTSRIKVDAAVRRRKVQLAAQEEQDGEEGAASFTPSPRFSPGPGGNMPPNRRHSSNPQSNQKTNHKKKSNNKMKPMMPMNPLESFATPDSPLGPAFSSAKKMAAYQEERLEQKMVEKQIEALREQKLKNTTVTMKNFVFHAPSTSRFFSTLVAKEVQEDRPSALSSPSVRASLRWWNHQKQRKIHSKIQQQQHEHSPSPSQEEGSSMPHNRTVEEKSQNDLPRQKQHRKPTAPHVVLAAHWDSKREPLGMLGAMDSAVSVLLLRQVMQELQWWKDLALLVRLAIIEDDENRGGEKSTPLQEEDPDVWEGDETKEDEEEKEEERVRAIIEQILDPSSAALLLEYAFPVGLRVQDTPPPPFSSASPSVSPQKQHHRLRDWLWAAADNLPDLSVVLFDGEEAMIEWKDADHTYGSRHLAEVWRHKPWPSKPAPEPSTADHHHHNNMTWMTSIDTFLLLDLVGGDDRSQFRNFFPHLSGHLFRQLAAVETERRRDEKQFLFGRKDSSEKLSSSSSFRDAARRVSSPMAAATWTSSWAVYGVPPLWHQFSVCEPNEAVSGSPRSRGAAFKGGSQTTSSTKNQPTHSRPVRLGNKNDDKRASGSSRTRPFACRYFPVQEALRPTNRPAMPNNTLAVEDDYMHWMDAGRPSLWPFAEDHSTVLEDAEAGTTSLSNATRVDPGMRLHVAMLPLVPIPFPVQWHTLLDDAEHVSYDMAVHFHELLMTFLLFPF